MNPLNLIATTALIIISTFGTLSTVDAKPMKELKKAKELKKLAAPAFKLRTLDGVLVRLDEIAYRGKEKSWAKKQPVLLDFFRTDCSPCIKALPELIAINEQYTNQGLRVIVVALLEEENGRQKLSNFLEKNPLPFTVVVDSNEHYSKKYLGESIKLPSSFFVDKTGYIVKSKQGGGGSMRDYFKSELTSLPAGP